MIYRRGPWSQGSPPPPTHRKWQHFRMGWSGVTTWIWGCCFLKELPFLSSLSAQPLVVLAGRLHPCWPLHRWWTHREVYDHPLRGTGDTGASHQEGALLPSRKVGKKWRGNTLPGVQRGKPTRGQEG
jgi:hypothetical protein